MNPLLSPLLAASAHASSALIAAAWQGILIALFVWIALRALPGLSATARSAVWTAAFLLIALLHFAPFAIGRAPAGSAGPLHTSPLHVNPWWAAGIAAVWLLASFARATQLLWGALHLRSLLREATSVPIPASVQPLLRIRRRTVRLCASNQVARPCVLGFFRPRILIPPALLAALSEDDLRQVALHEMQHLHRRDDWANLIQKLTLVLFPLNPALAWVERRLCAERELACDDRVLQSGAGRKAYAMCLAHLAEFALLRRRYALVLGAWERRPELVRRIQRILTQPGRTMGRKPALAVSATVMAAALACTVTLARAPRLVSFVPLAPSSAEIFAQRGQALDPAALSRAVGGTPQMVRATLPAAHPAPARVAVVKKHRNVQPPATQFAALRKSAPQADGELMQRDLVVMTTWSTADDTGQSEGLTVVREFQTVQTANPVQVVRAVYLVPTPDGWLVIKI